MSVTENFANEFITKLDNKIPPEQLKLILMELQVFANDYDIKEKITDIVPYENSIPNYYKVYMVAKKIEGTSPETLKTYNYYLTDFFEHIGRPIDKLITNDIRVYLYELQERTKITNRTLDGKRLVINTFLQWCTDEGYIPANPCRNISPIKYEVKMREPLSGVELEMVRDACETYREKAIIEMFYSTGCRVSEMARLSMSDINFQTKEVHLFGKGNKHRFSYINAKAEVMLNKYLKSRNDNSNGVFYIVT